MRVVLSHLNQNSPSLNLFLGVPFSVLLFNQLITYGVYFSHSLSLGDIVGRTSGMTT